MNRRTFLTALAGVLTAPMAALGDVSGTPTRRTRLLSARADMEGNAFLSALDEAGRIRYSIPLPARGHGIAVHPQGLHAVVVARRPGRFLVAFDIESGEVIRRANAAAERHMYGHAVFSSDGRWLYTTENDYRNKRGVIGVRDVAAAYGQVEEFPSYGLGPHELKLGGDAGIVVVANGGILTDPAIGRAKLNIDTMSPSLVYIQAATGKLLSEHRLPPELHQLSIRHLAVGADGRVCIAMQYEGSPADRPPLIGLHTPGEQSIELLEPPHDTLDRMRNYCGSVCTDIAGRCFAVSSPRGNLATFWSTTGAFLGSTEVLDGSGIAAAAHAGEFVLSSGNGGLYRCRAGTGGRTPLSEAPLFQVRWDNHLASAAL